MIRSACAGHATARLCAWPGQGVCHDTNFVSGLGAAFVLQYGYDTSYDTATVSHDTARGAATCTTHGLGAACVAIQPATRPARPATWPARLVTQPG